MFNLSAAFAIHSNSSSPVSNPTRWPLPNANIDIVVTYYPQLLVQDKVLDFLEDQVEDMMKHAPDDPVPDPYYEEDHATGMIYELRSEDWQLRWRIMRALTDGLIDFLDDQRNYVSMDFEFRRRQTDQLIMTGYLGFLSGIVNTGTTSIRKISKTTETAS